MEENILKKWDYIIKISKELDELYHKLASHYNLSDSAFWILYSLYESKKTCSQKEICDSWYFNKQTINSSIKKLEELGFIKKGSKESLDKKISLTSLGEKVAKNSVEEVRKIENIAYSKISEDELDNIINLLKKPLASFKEETDKLINNKDK